LRVGVTKKTFPNKRRELRSREEKNSRSQKIFALFLRGENPMLIVPPAPKRNQRLGDTSYGPDTGCLPNRGVGGGVRWARGFVAQWEGSKRDISEQSGTTSQSRRIKLQAQKKRPRDRPRERIPKTVPFVSQKAGTLVEAAKLMGLPCETPPATGETHQHDSEWVTPLGGCLFVVSEGKTRSLQNTFVGA